MDGFKPVITPLAGCSTLAEFYTLQGDEDLFCIHSDHLAGNLTGDGKPDLLYIILNINGLKQSTPGPQSSGKKLDKEANA